MTSVLKNLAEALGYGSNDPLLEKFYQEFKEDIEMKLLKVRIIIMLYSRV
jgi:hypothetical protein